SDSGDSNYGSIVIQNFIENSTTPLLNTKWASLYEAISRCNHVISVTHTALKKGTINDTTATLYLMQARGLRGHYHFEAWRIWGKIPFVDENTGWEVTSNKVDQTERIFEDLEYATSLPHKMKMIGQFNSTVVKVIYAKALMDIKGDFTKAQTLLSDVIANGCKPDGSPIGLESNYGDIFDTENRNGIESIYTVQYSVNDGSGGWNGGWGEALNFPVKAGSSPAGCCGFFQPTFEFVNSFRTQAGLPLLDKSYNDDPILSDMGLMPTDPFIEDTNPVDPRLDWTVGRRGIPYLDWGEHTGSDWIREQSFAGPYSPKKQVYRKSQEGTLTETGSWTKGFTANGYRMIRYADVLLLLAECQLETGNLKDALTNVNLIRTRAGNPSGFVMETDNITPAANYQIQPYTSFPDIDYARAAIRMERKLELGLEGHRFFDLRRWGIAQNEINSILSYETSRLSQMYIPGIRFGNEDLFYPIPQHQIDLSNGRITQNTR
ncbi:MAG: RagB/SusD family nutrient uptake outer membrane protein, partial [Cyclobacteriaceae bacterium]|nr:RagB/SusD family nutrient uptake outer membrane protein [Cyclobacteriaceae bacterium]